MHIIVIPVPPKISVVIREYYADAGGFVMGGLRGMGQISVMHNGLLPERPGNLCVCYIK